MMVMTDVQPDATSCQTGLAGAISLPARQRCLRSVAMRNSVSPFWFSSAVFKLQNLSMAPFWSVCTVALMFRVKSGLQILRPPPRQWTRSECKYAYIISPLKDSIYLFSPPIFYSINAPSGCKAFHTSSSNTTCLYEAFEGMWPVRQWQSFSCSWLWDTRVFISKVSPQRLGAKRPFSSSMWILRSHFYRKIQMCSVAHRLFHLLRVVGSVLFLFVFLLLNGNGCRPF